ncbi:MAG: hypothetical protein M1828_006168 [Chrysothrix sp. TS-e1954]|nr:MAG: hypothetical protein M1828_006168 [Chrysothrix sp. TS-e1954]
MDPQPANATKDSQTSIADSADINVNDKRRICLSRPKITLSDLQSMEDLWYRINVFVFDLRHFQDNKDCLNRLETVIDPCYLGLPYFSNEEVAMLKGIEGADGKPLDKVIQDTFDERLNRRNEKRVESGDFRICAAHDLAPIFENAFGIKPKELKKNKKFVALVTKKGLRLDGQSCDGLTGFAKHSPTALDAKRSAESKGKKKRR